MQPGLYKKEYFIDYNTLRNNLQADANYGIYIVNIAKISNSGEEYGTIGIEHPTSTSMEAALNINIGTIKEPHLINVPPTWIPLNLAEYGEPSDIIKSSGFKNMCEARYIALINKEGYDEIMQDEGARSTRDYISGLRFSATTRASDEDLVNSLNSKAIRTPTTKTEGIKKVKAANTLTPVVYTLCNKDSDESHSLLFQKYKANEPKLTTADLNYIVKHSQVKKMQEAAEHKLG